MAERADYAQLRALAKDSGLSYDHVARVMIAEAKQGNVHRIMVGKLAYYERDAALEILAARPSKAAAVIPTPASRTEELLERIAVAVERLANQWEDNSNG